MTKDIQMLTYLASQGLDAKLLRKATNVFEQEGQFTIALSGNPKKPFIEIVGIDVDIEDKLSIDIFPASIVSDVDSDSREELLKDAIMAEVGFSLAQELVNEKYLGL